MAKLFYFFGEMKVKDIYLISNITDILFTLTQLGLLSGLITFYIFNAQLNSFVNACFLILSIFTLFTYINRRSYRTKTHFVYMIAKLFYYIIACIFYVMFLIDGKIRGNTTRIYVLLAIQGIIYFVNFWWSILLMQNIN